MSARPLPPSLVSALPVSLLGQPFSYADSKAPPSHLPRPPIVGSASQSSNAWSTCTWEILATERELFDVVASPKINCRAMIDGPITNSRAIESNRFAIDRNQSLVLGRGCLLWMPRVGNAPTKRDCHSESTTGLRFKDRTDPVLKAGFRLSAYRTKTRPEHDSH